MLKEDIDALGPVPLKEVEAARQQVLNIIRQMEADGQLELTPGGVEYVS